jgi:hypothetical protein
MDVNIVAFLLDLVKQVWAGQGGRWQGSLASVRSVFGHQRGEVGQGQPDDEHAQDACSKWFAHLLLRFRRTFCRTKKLTEGAIDGCVLTSPRSQF